MWYSCVFLDSLICDFLCLLILFYRLWPAPFVRRFVVLVGKVLLAQNKNLPKKCNSTTTVKILFQKCLTIMRFNLTFYLCEILILLMTLFIIKNSNNNNLL